MSKSFGVFLMSVFFPTLLSASGDLPRTGGISEDFFAFCLDLPPLQDGAGSELDSGVDPLHFQFREYMDQADVPPILLPDLDVVCPTVEEMRQRQLWAEEEAQARAEAEAQTKAVAEAEAWARALAVRLGVDLGWRQPVFPVAKGPAREPKVRRYQEKEERRVRSKTAPYSHLEPKNAN